jgi:hypothetical protein
MGKLTLVISYWADRVEMPTLKFAQGQNASLGFWGWNSPQKIQKAQRRILSSMCSHITKTGNYTSRYTWKIEFLLIQILDCPGTCRLGGGSQPLLIPPTQFIFAGGKPDVFMDWSLRVEIEIFIIHICHHNNRLWQYSSLNQEIFASILFSQYWVESANKTCKNINLMVSWNPTFRSKCLNILNMIFLQTLHHKCSILPMTAVFWVAHWNHIVPFQFFCFSIQEHPLVMFSKSLSRQLYLHGNQKPWYHQMHSGDRCPKSLTYSTWLINFSIMMGRYRFVVSFTIWISGVEQPPRPCMHWVARPLYSLLEI